VTRGAGCNAVARQDRLQQGVVFLGPVTGAKAAKAGWLLRSAGKK
jgi:hypothetical protein